MVSTYRLSSLILLVSMSAPSFATEQNIPYCKDIQTSSFNREAALALAQGFSYYQRQDLCFRFVGDKSDLVRSVVTYSTKDGWKREYRTPSVADYATAFWQTRAATVLITVAGGYTAYRFSRYVATKFNAFRRVRQPAVILDYAAVDASQWNLSYARGPVKISSLQLPKSLVKKDNLVLHRDATTGHEFLLQYVPTLNLREGYIRSPRLELIYVGDDVSVMKASKGYWSRNKWSTEAWNELSPDAPPVGQRPVTADAAAPPPPYAEHEIDLETKNGTTPTFTTSQPGSPNSAVVENMKAPENGVDSSSETGLGTGLE